VAALAALLYAQSALALAVTLLILAMYCPGAALLTIPALLIWAPRLTLGEAGGESVFLRLDQFAVAGLIARGVLHPTDRLSSPPGHTAFVVFLSVVALSVTVGLLQGTLAAPMSALLYFAQWLEFYALFVAAWTFGARVQGWSIYAWAVPLVALATYGLAEDLWPFYENPDVRYRTFERVLFPGQANHAAGLFALATATGLGIASIPRYRVLGVALALLCTLALWPTGSRSGALAWAAGIGAFALIRVPSLRWCLPPLGIVGLTALPADFWARHSLPGSSMHDRLVAWKSALSTVDLYPLLGLGAGARHRSYYDNHYIMTLAESGLLGMILLIILILALARALGHQCKTCGMCAGALAGLAALAVHGLATATFIVTMTAGPLFWYAGVALARREETP
jgi:O-antigen ligase